MIERCVQLAQKAGDERVVGEAYSQWGRLLYLRGEYETADEYLQKALSIAQNHQDKSACRLPE
jgi:tetratricopeptide (TPR) repeat protein